jgi:hypothetical protein
MAVEPYLLDEDHWSEGFERVFGGQKRAPVPSTLKSKSRKKARTNAVGTTASELLDDS